MASDGQCAAHKQLNPAVLCTLALKLVRAAEWRQHACAKQPAILPRRLRPLPRRRGKAGPPLAGEPALDGDEQLLRLLLRQLQWQLALMTALSGI